MNTAALPEPPPFSVGSEIPTSVSSRVTISEPGPWVKMHEVDENFHPKHTHQQVILLLDRQYHAREQGVYQRVVQRLDTLQGVQNASQWTLDFDPSTQQVIIHSIGSRREGQQTEHAKLEHLRFLRRERQMERLVIDGLWTLVLLLEDVRVGDLLDIRFTIITAPRFLQHRFSMLTDVPCFVPIRAFRLSILFPVSDGMKWIGNDPQFTPEIQTTGEEVEWSWHADHLEADEPESNVPSWHFVSKYIQATNCASWQEVASAIAAVWPGEAEQPELVNFAEKLLQETPALPDAADKAIQFVQDEIRYLSVNEEVGGQIPAPPDVVLRRRFGDCKDKAVLLSHLLGRLGIEARPVLVNTFLKGKVRDLLPSANIFNHVIVEFKIGDQRHWVDATVSMQGGNALSRPHLNFEVGLPVDATTLDLAAIECSGKNNSYKIHESFRLDTTGGKTVLEVSCVATGIHADNLRRSLALEGVQALAKSREQFYRNLFPKITRLHDLEWKDDRQQNTLALAECFDVGKPFTTERDPNVCGFLYGSHLMQSLLAIPAAKTRKNPFSLPEPGEFEHKIEFQTSSMRRAETQRLYKHTGHLDYKMDIQKGVGFWTWNYTLNITSNVVEKNAFEAHRSVVEEIWPSTNISLLLPIGVVSSSHRALSPAQILGGLSWLKTEGASRAGTNAGGPLAGSRIRPRNAALGRESRPPAEAVEPLIQRKKIAPQVSQSIKDLPAEQDNSMDVGIKPRNAAMGRESGSASAMQEADPRRVRPSPRFSLSDEEKTYETSKQRRHRVKHRRNRALKNYLTAIGVLVCIALVVAFWVFLIRRH